MRFSLRRLWSDLARNRPRPADRLPRGRKSRPLQVETLENRCLLAISLVSSTDPSLASQIGNDASVSGQYSGEEGRYFTLSDTGQYAAFASYASNLAPGDSNTFSDVFVRDTVSGTTTRVSLSSSDAQADGDSAEPSISGDGAYVAFSSDADNLVPGDINGLRDVFVKNLTTGAITRVSTGTGDIQAEDPSGLGLIGSFSPVISRDGRYVAFASDAENLVPDDTNYATDIFVKELQTGVLVRVSLDAAGQQFDAASTHPALSSDGSVVAFEHTTDFGTSGIFVKNVHDGALVEASTNVAGVSGDGGSYYPAISGDGRYVAFQSDASNLIAADGNGRVDIFVKDLQTQAMVRVSESTAHVETDDASYAPAISANGQRIAYFSEATNLVPGDVNLFQDPTLLGRDVFVWDRTAGTTVLASVDSSGQQGSGDSAWPAISGDGAVVSFQSDATTLVANDTNALSDVFLRTLATGTTTLASASDPGVATSGDGDSAPPAPGNAISSDGNLIVFQSLATNLLPGHQSPNDYNAYDIFLKNRETGQLTLLSVNPQTGEQADADCYAPSISRNGRYVVFDSSASNLVAGDDLDTQDVFLIDLQNLQAGPTRVSVAQDGTPADDASSGARISDDGRYVVFSSLATNLLASPAPVERVGVAQVYRKDLITGDVALVSVTAAGDWGDNYSDAPSVSSDGRYVLFESWAGNFGVTTTTMNIFRKDFQTGTVMLISADNATGDPGDGTSWSPTMSSDGRYVAFVSSATNLLGPGGDPNGELVSDVFVADLNSSTRLKMVDTNIDGVPANDAAFSVAISGSGRYIAFDSLASNLIEGDTNQFFDVFMKDLQSSLGAVRRISTDSAGGEANADSGTPSVSDDGKWVVFQSLATNLVGGDAGFSSDVFLADGFYNHPPVAYSQNLVSKQGEPVTVTLGADSGDPGIAQQLTYNDILVYDPQGWTYEQTADTVTCTPPADFTGIFTFYFYVTDDDAAGDPPNLDSNFATVSITVRPVNHAPAAFPQSVAATEDQTEEIQLSGNSGDTFAQTLSYAIVTKPLHGTAFISDPNNGIAQYTPDPNYNGPDSFTFTITDDASGDPPNLTSDEATVTISVAAVNDPPAGTPQDLTTQEDTALPLTLTGDDGAAEVGQVLTFALVTGPQHGTLSVLDPQTGSVTYTPNPNYNGPDSFTFTVTDDAQAGPPAGLTSVPATVSITVAPVNDPPTATPQSVNTAEDTALPVTLAGDGGDADVAQALTFALVTDPQHGTLSGFDPLTGSVTYTPNANYNGPDSFTFTVTDDDLAGAPATLTSTTATVSITVAPVNDPPTAVPQSAATYAGVAKTLTLAGDDGDPDVVQTLTFAIETHPTHGTVTVDATGKATYTALAGYTGQDSFKFTVTDDASAGGSASTSAPATVTLSVTPPPIVPLGQVAYAYRAGLDDPSGGEIQYTLQAYRVGVLSITATVTSGSGTALLNLLDSNGRTVATSTVVDGVQRLDYGVLKAGDGFTLKLSGSATAVDLRVVNQLALNATNKSVTVYGSTAKDVFQFDATTGRTITVNTIAYRYTAADVASVSFNGSLGGDDSIAMVGNAANERVSVYAALVTVTATVADSYQVNATNMKTSTFDGGGGKNSAIFFEGPGGGAFVGSPGNAHFSGTRFDCTLSNVANVTANGSSAGADTATLDDSTGIDTFIGQTTGSGSNAKGAARLIGGWGSLYLVGFGSVTATSHGGVDSARLFDSSGDDTLSGDLGGAVTLASSNYRFTVSKFPTVTAMAATGNDTVALTDTTGNDSLSAYPTSMTLRSSGANSSLIMARGFDAVDISATRGGVDTATLYGSAGSDTFTGRPVSAELTGTGFSLKAEYFDNVFAYSGGGADTASFYDAPGTADTFTFFPPSGQNYSRMNGRTSSAANAPTYANQANGFLNVYAYATLSDADTATLNGSTGDDILTVRGPTVSDPSHYAKLTDAALSWLCETTGFNSVTAISNGGYDLRIRSGNTSFLIAVGTWN